MSRLKPSPAMVVAFIALIASVTGGAYAAVAARSVTNRELADNSVWHRNIGTHSVRNANINNGAVNNRTLAANSVWHAQIGTGSVRLVNIQPATVDQLQSKSADFANLGPTDIPPRGVEGPRVAGDTISTTAGQKFLVLNGFVIVNNIGDTEDAAVCGYEIDGSNIGIPTQRAVPAKSEVQIGIVARHPVKAGRHTVDVFCSSVRTIDLSANGTQVTAIATG